MIGFIGSGQMAAALIRCFDGEMMASDRNQERRDYVKELGVKTTQNNVEVVTSSDIVFLCVKPGVINDVLDEIADSVKDQIIISIAAGIRLETLQAKLPGKKIIRLMPNTPCLVGEMAGGYSIGSDVNEQEEKKVNELLSKAGKVFLLDEKDLDAVTGLSGSGPAFFAEFISAMIKAGMAQGLKEDVAKTLAIKTAIGTGKLLEGMEADELVKMVSSPGGTTVAGLKVLTENKFSDIVIDTIKAATQRSRELGK